MTGFLSANGSPLGLYGQFVSLNMSDDEVAARALENAGLMVFPEIDEVFEDQLGDEINGLLYGCAMVKLDSTGIIDSLDYDNPYFRFDEHTVEDPWVFYRDGIAVDAKEDAWSYEAYPYAGSRKADNDNIPTPGFHGRTRNNVTTGADPWWSNPKPDYVRGKEHRQPGGWKRFGRLHYG